MYAHEKQTFPKFIYYLKVKVTIQVQVGAKFAKADYYVHDQLVQVLRTRWRTLHLVP